MIGYIIYGERQKVYLSTILYDTKTCASLFHYHKGLFRAICVRVGWQFTRLSISAL